MLNNENNRIKHLIIGYNRRSIISSKITFKDGMKDKIEMLYNDMVGRNVMDYEFSDYQIIKLDDSELEWNYSQKDLGSLFTYFNYLDVYHPFTGCIKGSQ
jgi:hypothetical protein